ncbi:MAG: hypothetical protein ABI197_12590, partial [Granulicella sp.]
VVMLLVALASGCRRETPIERAAREYRDHQRGQMALATLDTMRLRTMTDSQIVRAYARNGLGLGVRPDKTELHVGEALHLHLIYANIAARTPISATTCQGFLLTQEEEATSRSATVPLTFDCSKTDPLRNNSVELKQNELKTAEITTADTGLRFDHPGRYRLFAQWQSLRPGSDILLRPSGYPILDSNPLLITVR